MSFIERLSALFSGPSGNGGGDDSGEITCHEALNVVHDFLDGELDGVSEQEVRAHFEVCEVCYPHLHLEELFKEALQKVARGEQAPPELRAKVVELLAQADK
jgi:anti-sigma factor (TIGR02949 family)